MEKGADFIVDTDIRSLGRRMNALVGTELIDPDALAAEITARDREIDNPFAKDMQILAIRGMRAYRGDRLCGRHRRTRSSIRRTARSLR